MKVGDRKQLGLALHDPLFPVYGLTFWAMAIPAAIVKIPLVSACRAAADMSAQRRRPTPSNSIECLDHLKTLGVLF